MAKLVDTSVSLCFYGDDLDPDALTRALGVAPSQSGRKGEVFVGEAGRSRVVKTGYWRLQSENNLSGDMDTQIAAMLAQMTDSDVVWRDLSQRYDGRIFFGWFLTSGNDMADISAQTLQACAARGLAFCFDVYDFTDESAVPSATD